MKRIFSLFVFILAANVSFAQINSLTPNVTSGQLLNLSNAILGAVNDTVTNSATLYLTIAKWDNSDTSRPYPLYAKSQVSIIVSGTKISGTPAGTVKMQESIDGVIWGDVRLTNAVVPTSTLTASVTTTYTNTTPDIFTITNVSAQTNTWDFANTAAPYKRLVLGVTGTQVSSWKAFWVSKNN